MLDEEKHAQNVLDQLRQQFCPNLPKDVEARVRAHKGTPVATEDAPLSELEGIPVIVADDVAAYVALEEGTEVSDLVASMAPPFDQFFIEFQRVPNQQGLHAWGAHFKARGVKLRGKALENSPPPRWMLEIETYMEKHKGAPFGPVARHWCGLAEDGTWFKQPNGELIWNGGFVEMSVVPPKEVEKEWCDIVCQLLFPALMALSFMHCKNVSLEAVVPSEKLSRNHRKRHGHPLVSYGELHIDPIRKVLEQQRQGAGGSLRKALHLCRGHFKIFTDDAPLLGRATGTYWWAPQVRGACVAAVLFIAFVSFPSCRMREFSRYSSCEKITCASFDARRPQESPFPLPGLPFPIAAKPFRPPCARLRQPALVLYVGQGAGQNWKPHEGMVFMERWRWKQSSANPSPPRNFPVTRENPGKFWRIESRGRCAAP